MDRFFAAIHDWFGPLVTRTAFRAYWLIAGFIPAVLFLTTGKPLPRAMSQKEDLTQGYPSDSRHESIGNRIVAVQIPEQPKTPDAPVTPCKIAFKDRVNGAELGTIDNYIGGRITTSWVDQIHDLLAIGSAARNRVDFYSWPVCTSLGVGLETGSCYELAFSRDGTRVVTRTDRGLKEWDRTTGAEVCCWNPYTPRLRDGAWSSPRLYYNQENRPQLIRTPDTMVARWDLHSGETDFRLEPECSIYDGDKESWLFALDTEHGLLACVLNDREIGLWSLEEGKLRRSFQRPSGLDYLRFSPDARFLAYRRCRELRPLLLDWLVDKSPVLQRIYCDNRSSTGIIALCDPLAGTTWAFPNSHYCEFADDCSRVYSCEAGGPCYEYDLPPRWQRFTPWAWVALGVWLGLAVLWWSMGPEGDVRKTLLVFRL